MILLLLIGFILIEWLGRKDEYGLEKFGLKWKRPVRYMFYYLLILSIFWFGNSEEEFIYFQF